MKKISISLLLCLVAFATGCPKYRPSVDFNNKDSFVNKVNAHFKTRQDDYYTAVKDNKPDKAKIIRNELLEDALPYIDDAYADFINNLARGRDRSNFIADVIELGTSAAVGITNGERPIQILGIALTAFRGGRRSADLNFYKDQSTPILISKMDGSRADMRATILQKEDLGVDKYPMGAAIRDIVDYYNAGTLVRAFVELSKDTAVQTRQSEDNVRKLRGVKLTNPSTEDQTKTAQDALSVLRTINSSLRSSDEEDKAAALKKLQNIVKALESDSDVAPLLKVAEINSEEEDGTKLLNGLRNVARKFAPGSAVRNKIDQAVLANGR